MMEPTIRDEKPTTNFSAKLLIAIIFLPLVVIFAIVKQIV